jgi:serine/threonine-protein kinase
MSKPERHTEPPDSATHHWAFQVERDLTGMTLGDFRIERILGNGGMGEVYLARQLSLDRPVALKVLRPDLLANPTYLARFEKEALSAAKLNDPNIVHVYNLGGFDKLKYIAMEYVPGTNLREYMTKKGIPELALALSIMRQAGQGIKAAGEVGLIHRDIKPENLLITRKGQVKVADFGLSRAPAEENVNLTQTGVTLGTPMYMSPEQVQGHQADHRSDLYSLGVTFYHMLAGVPPYRADNALALALKHVREDPVDLSVHRPDLPPDLCKLVMKLIEKRPSDRYQSAGEMLRDLAKVKESLHVPTAAIAAAEAAAGAAIQTTAALNDPETKREKKPSAAGRLTFAVGKKTIAALVVLGALGGAAAGYMARTEDLLKPAKADAEGDEPSPPGLWIAAWHAIPARKTPDAQYRYAQLEASESEREAAWLAVPGRFPRSHEWSTSAYTQLVRTLFHNGDWENLDGLAAGLALSARAHDQQLAKVARAASASLRGDAEEVLERLDGLTYNQIDPALTEISLELTMRVREHESGAGTISTQLDKQRTAMVNALQIPPLIMNRLFDLGLFRQTGRNGVTPRSPRRTTGALAQMR